MVSESNILSSSCGYTATGTATGLLLCSVFVGHMCSSDTFIRWIWCEPDSAFGCFGFEGAGQRCGLVFWAGSLSLQGLSGQPLCPAPALGLGLVLDARCFVFDDTTACCACSLHVGATTGDSHLVLCKVLMKCSGWLLTDWTVCQNSGVTRCGLRLGVTRHVTLFSVTRFVTLACSSHCL